MRRVMKSWTWLLCLPLVGCVASNTDEDLDDIPDAAWGGKADSGRIYVSAQSVDELGGDLSSLRPACRTADPSHNCEFYLSPGSALGDFGPLGAYGPLGTLGPLGSNAWSASYWISAAGDWSSWSREETGLGGPLSESGPLGPDGPLGDRAYYETLPAINDWAKQLQGGGVWTSLGPLGALGVLGPLGPLGPIGAHGYEQDDHGRYLHDGNVVRTVRAASSSFELVEMYDEATATAMHPNDTSFLALGTLERGAVDKYDIKSRHDQFVTILVVPEKQLDNFDITIKTPEGRELATSHSSSYIDWVQLQAPRGGRMTVEVSLAASGHLLSKTYRLYVVGSGAKFSQTDIRGDHQLPL